MRVAAAPEHAVPERPLTVPQKMELTPVMERLKIVFDDLGVL